MTELPPLHACITSPELNQYLQQLANQTTNAHIHPEVISFYTGIDRCNLEDDMPLSDHRSRGVYSNFWRNAPGRLNRAAFFSTPVKTYVAKSEIDWKY